MGLRIEGLNEGLEMRGGFVEFVEVRIEIVEDLERWLHTGMGVERGIQWGLFCLHIYM